ncbi:hypothetical protein B0O80DRAFT_65056 [Mortierella sp. GBAus27b]|nr:hypothetical protein B0O80DRAFT_65056 [Mortierella sp. GBAus27b]
MKTAIFSLAATLIFTCLTSAAPILVLEPNVVSLSLRSAGYSPATDRRTAPADICQPGRPETLTNPICNPSNYPSGRPPYTTSNPIIESNEGGSGGGRSSDGRSMQSRSQDQNQRLEKRTDTGQKRIGRGDQDPCASIYLRKRLSRH